MGCVTAAVQRSVSRAAVFAVESAGTMAGVCVVIRTAGAAEGRTQFAERLMNQFRFYSLYHGATGAMPKCFAPRYLPASIYCFHDASINTLE